MSCGAGVICTKTGVPFVQWPWWGSDMGEKCSSLGFRDWARKPLPFDVSSSVSQMWYVLWSGTSDPLNASQLCSVIHSKIHCDHDVFLSFLCEGSLICYLTAPAHKIYDDLCSLTIATSLMMLGAGPFIWRQEAARDATRGFVSGGISSARICKQQPLAGRDKSHPFLEWIF